MEDLVTAGMQTCIFGNPMAEVVPSSESLVPNCDGTDHTQDVKGL